MEALEELLTPISMISFQSAAEAEAELEGRAELVEMEERES